METKTFFEKESLEKKFEAYRSNIIGLNQTFEGPYGRKKIVYMDWTASGRLYKPIEEKIQNEFGPFVANTHTETSYTGKMMTNAYHHARNLIKKHVNASPDDVLITAGTGMTGVINKFQRILGLRIPENSKEFISIPLSLKPVVFVSHMEHHSNQTSWLETIADVVVVPCDNQGLFCLNQFKKTIQKYRKRSFKIASITSCSNVTGIKTPYHEVAKLMHQIGGVCFVDFACSGPYVHIDMHPEDSDAYLDAIFFSPHKFLGGPGTSGVLIFNKKMYKNNIPDCPGGGTVSWTNPWGEHQYIANIEEREDGGTPGFLQVIRTALAIELKENMGIEAILNREKELIAIIFKRLEEIKNCTILAGHVKERLGVFSFYIDDLHYNLAVKMLNDRFGIQTRGGCSCAGTYGHYLLHIDQQVSKDIICQVSLGDMAKKPGWIRMSIHPTTTNEEIEFVCDAIKQVALNFKEWSNDYVYDSKTNDFISKIWKDTSNEIIQSWFKL